MIHRLKPAAGVEGELCNVAQGKELFLTGWVCNTGAAVEYVTVYALKAGEAISADTELYHNLKVPANDTFTFTPIHLDAGESIRVKAQNGTAVFTLTGQEVTK